MTTTLLGPDGVGLTAKQFRQARAALYGGNPSRPLGGRSGFRPGTPSDTLTATSTTWTLKPCAAMIDPGATTHQGMYGWASDANITGAVTPADATYARKDIVYIQINDQTAGDSTGEVTYPPKYLAGPADGTNVPPPLPLRSFLVGTLAVPIAGGGSPAVTLNPARFAAAGAPLPVKDSTERDGLDKFDGLTVRRLDLAGRPTEQWDGTAWLPTPVVTGFYAPLTIGAFATSGDVVVEQVGSRKRVTVSVRVLRNSGTSLSVGTSFIPLGTVLPTQARGGSTGNELYFPISIVAGGANIVAQAAVHPVTGIFYVQGTSSFTWPDVGLTTFNCVYYI